MHHGYIPKYIDHIDRNPLNNDIDNLRECSQSQNLCNKSSGKSKYKGVFFDKQTGKWRSKIKKNKISYCLGRHSNEKDAAMAYDKAAKKLHGEFAYLNFP